MLKIEPHHLGEAIRQLRHEHKMTQDDLASACGVSYSALSRYERGSRPPSIAIANKIAEALKVHTIHLFIRANRVATDETNAQIEADAAASEVVAEG